jgi:hypothetical protein
MMASAKELREEAEAAEAIARMVSYGPDRQSLKDRAEALRREADRQEQRARRPPEDRH